MTSNIQDQDGYIIPPRVGFVVCQAVDSTSRGYDMTALNFQDEDPLILSKNSSKQNYIWVDMEAITADIYFAFDSAAVGTNTILDTTTNTAGTAWTAPGWTPPASANTSYPCGHIAAGTIRPVRVDRQTDRTLILKCASGSTATLRMTPSSQSLPGATRGA
jgi:hypothetical protein